MNTIEEKLTTKWYRDYSHKLHMQRLKDIKTHGSKRIDNSAPKTKESIPLQKQAKEFLRKEQVSSIAKKNIKLLQILTEISEGKRETVTQRILNSTKEAPTLKSLNINVRKKEARRIDEDNEAFIRRLNGRTAELSFKKFEEDWVVLSKYKDSISKKNYRYGSSQLSTRLPRIENASGSEKISAEVAPSEKGKSLVLSSNEKNKRKKNLKKNFQIKNPEKNVSQDDDKEKVENEEEKNESVNDLNEEKLQRNSSDKSFEEERKDDYESYQKIEVLEELLIEKMNLAGLDNKIFDKEADDSFEEKIETEDIKEDLETIKDAKETELIIEEVVEVKESINQSELKVNDDTLENQIKKEKNNETKDENIEFNEKNNENTIKDELFSEKIEENVDILDNPENIEKKPEENIEIISENNPKDSEELSKINSLLDPSPVVIEKSSEEIEKTENNEVLKNSDSNEILPKINIFEVHQGEENLS